MFPSKASPIPVGLYLLAVAVLSVCASCLAGDATICCTVTSDSTHSRFHPNRILDGDTRNPESRWASAKTSGDHWVAIQFPEPLGFDRIVLYGHEGELALADAVIEIMRDGTWEPVGRLTDNRQAVVEVRIGDTKANGLRIRATRACQRDDCVRLFEVELWRGNRQLPLRAKSSVPSSQPSVEPATEPSALIGLVRPFPPAALTPAPSSERATRLMRDFYKSILRWDDILVERLVPVPGKSDCGYYGLSGHQEDQVRPITYAILVNAFLAEVTPPPDTPTPSEERRQRMREHAIAALRYLVQAHQTGDGACADGQKWGHHWQSAMWTRSLGLAGWMLWPYLDSELKSGVARVVEYETDRFLYLKPKSSEVNDTGAEENAWNAQILSLACNMMPTHSRAERWAAAAKLWMANSLSVAADAADRTPLDDGRSVCEWVQTVNVHPDFTIENHGIVHVGYLKTSASLLLENSLPYLLVSAPVPKACLHHASDVFQVALQCMGWDGAAIYFSGNDWKLVHTQGTDVMLYAYRSILAGDPYAAYLEDVALDAIRRLQQAEEGHYSPRRDLEYGGLCATRGIACYFAHALCGEGAAPCTADAFDRKATGVSYLEHGRAILHRTPTKFASFSWGAKRMALALPRDGASVLWPHFASYVGELNGRDASNQNARLTAFRHRAAADSFTVTAVLDRFDGTVQQALSYSSLPEDMTVYIERITTKPGFSLQSRETGIIGLEYDLGANERTLYGPWGERKAVGIGGQETRVVLLHGDWLNIDGRVGYVVRRFPLRANAIHYHDQPCGTGRVPKLQEWISLIADTDSERPSYAEPEWACLVTFLNQRPVATRDAEVNFSVDGETATCRVGAVSIQANFATLEQELPRHP